MQRRATMPKVNFYLLKQNTEQARAVLACRLAEKLLKQKLPVQILVSSLAAASVLDQLLWSFSADSFVPHALCSDPLNMETPVTITWDQQPCSATYLLNLTTAIPINHAALDTIAEIIVNDEAAKTHSRQLWNTYKQLGYPLQLHQL
jgi:DNA polymerase-3 subunit chi